MSDLTVTPTSVSLIRRLSLAIGSAVAAMLLIANLSLGVDIAVSAMRYHPSTWDGVPTWIAVSVGALVALVEPVVATAAWHLDRRTGNPLSIKIEGFAIFGITAGLFGLVVVICYAATGLI
jgi:hypothetical protein